MKTEPIEAYEAIEYYEANNINIDAFRAKKLCDMAFYEGQSSPKIKQLEWVEDYGCIMAETPFLKYLVLIIGGKAGLCFDGNDEFLKFRTVDEAKAAGQADFEKRIRECLE